MPTGSGDFADLQLRRTGLIDQKLDRVRHKLMVIKWQCPAP